MSDRNNPGSPPKHLPMLVGIMAVAAVAWLLWATFFFAWLNGTPAFNGIDNVAKKLADGLQPARWFEALLQPAVTKNPDAYAHTGRMLWFNLMTAFAIVAPALVAAGPYYFGLGLFSRHTRFVPRTRLFWWILLVLGLAAAEFGVATLVLVANLTFGEAVVCFVLPVIVYYAATALFSPHSYKYSAPGSWWLRKW